MSNNLFGPVFALLFFSPGNDLLGSGPKNVDELRKIHSRLCTRYLKAIDRKERQVQRQTGIQLASTEPLGGIAENMRDTAGNVFDKFSLPFLSSNGGGTW